jgi:predicted N-acetyltransferase YhbS
MKIRTAQLKDYQQVFDLIQQAFEEELHSDHKEQFLVQRLRNSENFIPELAIVAENDDQVVGFILLTKIKIINPEKTANSLALAPVAVYPDFQNQGIGSELIKYAHKKAFALGFESIFLLGHANFYPRFGYKPTYTFNIQLPFNAPDENCMAVELKPAALHNVYGSVKYPNEFYE